MTPPRTPAHDASAPPSGAGVLALRVSDALSLHSLIEAGLRWSSIERLARALALPLAQIAETARIAPRTLTRRREEGRFDADESERLVRLGRLVDLAVQLFEGDLPGARRWLAAPQPALGGRTPLELSRTEVGAREVEALIGRLEHGIPS
jgi:putative toxin-antitoxin system antitoxin component (TIGR02293 family)